MTALAARNAALGRTIADVVVLAVALHILLVAGWLSNGVQGLARARVSAALVMQAVVKAGVSDEGAEGIASRISHLRTGVAARSISEAEARGLLALQEPWMKDLPSIEIGRLPGLIEVRAGDVALTVAEFRALRDEIAAEPEIQFVIFNDVGLEDLVAFTSNADWYAGAMRTWLTLLVSIAVALYAWRTSLRVAPSGAALVRRFGVFVVACVIAYVGLRVVASRASSHFALDSFSLMAAWRGLLLCALLWIAGSLGGGLMRARVKAA